MLCKLRKELIFFNLKKGLKSLFQAKKVPQNCFASLDKNWFFSTLKKVLKSLFQAKKRPQIFFSKLWKGHKFYVSKLGKGLKLFDPSFEKASHFMLSSLEKASCFFQAKKKSLERSFWIKQIHSVYAIHIYTFWRLIIILWMIHKWTRCYSVCLLVISKT